MLAQAKDGWAALGCVTPDSLEDAGTVVKNMRHNMHAGIVPVDKLSVVSNDVTDSRRAHVFRFTIFWKHSFDSFRKSDQAI